MVDQTPVAEPAETETAPVVYPGDVVQIIDVGHAMCRALGIVHEVHGWGVGAMFLAVVDGVTSEAYQRLKVKGPGRVPQFAVVGAALIMPGEVFNARKDSLAHAAAVAREAGR